MKLIVHICLLVLLSLNAFSKIDSLWTKKPTIHFLGFVDAFYAYDFNSPNGNRQNFIYNYNRHNSFDINLAVLKMNLTHVKYRANLALEGGTFVIDNYASEPPAIQGIYEANVGFSLNKKNTLWVDAGIFPSHIGFESAIAIDDWTLSRTLISANSPFFLSGIKLSYQIKKKLDFVAIASNGWQIIKPKGKSVPSIGTQINYHPNEKFSLNWSTMIGSEYADISKKMRYFNDFYGQFKLSKKLSLLTGFDIGVEQTAKNSNTYNLWFGPAILTKYSFNDVWSSTLRLEYYEDKNGVLINVVNPNGFNTYGISSNIDFRPNKQLAIRMEGRWFGSKDNILESTNPSKKQNFTLLFSLAIKLEQ